MARACGVADTRVITDEAGVAALAARQHAPSGEPLVAVIRIAQGEDARVLPSRDGAYLRLRTEAALARAA